MLGERTCAGRACEYARKIEHTDPRKWAITLGERLGPRLSDFDDLQERQSGYCGGLRVLRPLLAGSSHATRSLGGDNCLFEFKPVPLGDGLCHGIAFLRHAENFECRCAVVREVAVEVAPSSFPGRIYPHDVIAFGQQLTVTKLHVVSAAEGGGRLADIDRYLLTPPGALFPKASCGQSGGCDGRGTGRANSKGRGQYWVGASRECDGVGCLRCPTYDR